jgi:hypothetical protein
MKGIIRALCILIIMLLLVITPDARSQDDLGPIYESILNLLSSEGHRLMLVLDPTVQVRPSELEKAKDPRFAEAFPDISIEQLDHLITLNESHASIRPLVQDNNRWIVLSEKQQTALKFGTPHAARAVHKVYPKADLLVRISRPCFNATADVAMIYVETYGNCDHPCGGTGSLLSMRHTEGRWKMDSRTLLWRVHW